MSGESEEDDKNIKKIVNEFSEVFDKVNLPTMNTEPMVIKLKENYEAKALTIPRKVPYARREEEIKEIRKMEADGIIEAIGDRPTEFCSPTICPIKPDGSLRFATDFTHLNKQVLRTVHPTLSTWDVIHSINPKAKYFSTFDCKKGYWQVGLAEESKDLTTFICTLGKFRYTRAPMGFISTGDSYNQRSDKALHGLKNIAKIVDDILIASVTYEQHLEDVKELLKRCKENQITLNRKKMMLGRKKVKFAGYVIGQNGIQLDPDKIEAVNRFPTPATRQDLKSFMVLINQFRQFNQAVTKSSYLLKPLLSSKVQYIWLPEHQKAFEDLKKDYLHLQA